MGIWHYTTRSDLQKILATETIIRTGSFEQFPHTPKVVWLSSTEPVDPVIRKPGTTGQPLSLEETALKFGGIRRIEVFTTAAPYTWHGFAKAYSLPLDYILHNDKGARMVGSDPTKWHVSLDDIKSHRWISIEALDFLGMIWTPVTDEELGISKAV